FEIRRSTDPNSSSSIPTPTYTVDGAGGGTHTTISAAISAANGSGAPYIIIGIAPGTYTGGSNVQNITINPTPKVLFIGLQGAAKTILDAQGSFGWNLYSTSVVSSLTFKNATTGLRIASSAQEVRLGRPRVP